MKHSPVPLGHQSTQISAVSDITGLVDTGLRLSRFRYAPAGEWQTETSGQLLRDLQRGAMAYVDVLTRSRSARLDEVVLRRCRLAAEQVMPIALAHQPDLCRFMNEEGVVSEVLPAIRQDVWRLLQLLACLDAGMPVLRRMSNAELVRAKAIIARLRRRLRRALQTYVRAVMRKKVNESRQVMKARADALGEIGPLGATQAERLADLEADVHASLNQWRLGLVKPMLDLAVDWQRPHVVADGNLVQDY